MLQSHSAHKVDNNEEHDEITEQKVSKCALLRYASELIVWIQLHAQ